MNEIASQGIGGAVSQLQVLEIYSFLRGYLCLHGNLDSCHGEKLVLKIEPTNRHNIQCSGHLQDAEIEAMFLTI